MKFGIKIKIQRAKVAHLHPVREVHRSAIMRSLSFFFVFFLITSFCFAAMTIYFKDGSSRQVYKISFKGPTAELYQLDGSVVKVPVEKLDLPSSGIGAPVGTYGETRVIRTRPVLPSGSLRAADPDRQKRLKMEWEDSEEIAIAINDTGTIRKGDTVKIVGQTQNKPQKRTYGYYEDQEYYDEDGSVRTYRTYKRRPLTLDEAYVILYKNPDGTFGKRLFDAASFSANFRIPSTEAKARPKSLPVEPLEPEPVPPPSLELKPPEREPGPSAQAPEASTGEDEPASETDPSNKVDPSKYEAPSRKWVPFAAVVTALVALGIGFFAVKAKQKPFVNTSKFAHYEEDLREFEIAIWLKNGKTADQILEICLKKFYQDNPAAVNLAIKVWKGGQKGLLLPLIMKQSGKGGPEAEAIYAEFQSRIDRIRHLIQDVSIRTGVTPAQQAESVDSLKTQSMAATGPTSVVSQTPVQKPSSEKGFTNPASVTKNRVTGPTAETSAPPSSVPSPSVPSAPAGFSASSSVSPSVRTPEKDAPNYSGTSSVGPAPVPPRPFSPPSNLPPSEWSRQHTDLPAYASNVLNQIGFLSGADEKLT